MDLELVQDIPGYKGILKSVLKTQIQLLVEQLCEQAEEESIILTASLSDGSLSHLGSEMGKRFFDEREGIKSQFLDFCLKNVPNTRMPIKKDNSPDTQVEGCSSPKRQRFEPDVGLAVNQDIESEISLVIMKPASHIMPVAGTGKGKSKKKKHPRSYSPTPSPISSVTSPAPEGSVPSDQSTDIRKTQKKNPLPSHSPTPSPNSTVTSPVSEGSVPSDQSTDSQVVKVENDDGWVPDDYTHLIDSEVSLNMAKRILSLARFQQIPTKDLDVRNRHSNKGVTNDSGRLEKPVQKQFESPNLEDSDDLNQTSRIKIESGTDDGQEINGIDEPLWAVGSEEETEWHSYSGQKNIEIDDYDVIEEDTKTLVKDVDSQLPQIFQCERCGLEFRTNSSLIRHVKHIHDRNDKYKCKICGKIEAKKNKLKTHIEVKHEGRCWICEICASSFKSSGGLRQHMKIKHSDMVVRKARYWCKKCSKPFKDKDVYLGHMSKHDGAKLYACCLCSRQYQYKNNLKIHILTQHSEKSLKCDHCEMSFGNTKLLQDHVNGKHSQVEKYGCECGRRFRWRSSLSCHRKKCPVMWLK